LRSTARIPSSASTFIALAPLQPLRKSPRRSSSASVSASFWAKVFTGSLRASSITVYDTTFDWLVVLDSTALPSEPLLPFRLASSPEYRLCGRSLWTAMPKVLRCGVHGGHCSSEEARRIMPHDGGVDFNKSGLVHARRSRTRW